MEKKRILVTSNHEPENTNVIWHDSKDNAFKEYNNVDWNIIGGETKQKTIEIGYFGNDPELLYQQNIYAWNCLMQEIPIPTPLTDDFDLFKQEFVVPGISTDPEDLESFYDFVFKYYTLPVNELIKELDKGNRPIIKIIPMYGSSDGLIPFADDTIIESYNIQMFVLKDQIESLGFSPEEARELMDKYKNKIFMQFQDPGDRSVTVQFVKNTFILSSIMSSDRLLESPIMMFGNSNGINAFMIQCLLAPM